jgi:hypothetical protein
MISGGDKSKLRNFSNHQNEDQRYSTTKSSHGGAEVKKNLNIYTGPSYKIVQN